MNETLQTLSHLPAATWFLVAGAVVLGWALSWAWRWYRRRRAQKALVAAVTASSSEYLRDVLVPDGMGGFFHVDFLLLTPRGILVIDLRDVRGNIFGGDQMTEWTVMDGPQRFTFTNPQGALYDRIAAVRAVASDAPTEGRIVFTKRGKFPKGLPKWTLMVDTLRTEFPSLSDSMLPASTVERFEAAWHRLKSSVTPSSINQIRANATRHPA
jgi:hypothetical protein